MAPDAPEPSGGVPPPGCAPAAPVRPSLRARLLQPILRRFMKARLRRLTAGGAVAPELVARSRARIEGLVRLGGKRSRGIEIQQRVLGGVDTEVLVPHAPHTDVHLLYLHGGAFAMGTPRTHRSLTRRLALAAHARAVVPAYRLAPEHPYPDGLEDVRAVYHGLLAAGVEPARIVVAGESAGGNLVLALVHALRAAAAPLPGALVCLSPWADLAGTGATLIAHAESDSMVPVEAMPVAVRMYAGNHDLRTPTISPLYGDFHGFPPLCVHVSSSEVLYDDARRVVSAAQAAGVDAQLRVWNGLPHAFPAFVDLLPEARMAVAEIAAFIARVLQ
jgi:epsilon-lactone hydrolase